jgi:hypothetical protein
MVRRPLENLRVGLVLIFRLCMCVTSKRLRDDCGLPESKCSGARDAAWSCPTRSAAVNLVFYMGVETYRQSAAT